MSRKNMDDVFRDGLKGYSSEIDPNEIWSGIQAKKPGPVSDDEDRRRPFIWWFFGAMLVVVAGSFLLFANSTDSNSMNADTSLSKMSLMNQQANTTSTPISTNNNNTTAISTNKKKEVNTTEISSTTTNTLSEKNTVAKRIESTNQPTQKSNEINSNAVSPNSQINTTSNQQLNFYKPITPTGSSINVTNENLNNNNNIQATNSFNTSNIQNTNDVAQPISNQVNNRSSINAKKIATIDLLEINEAIPIVSTTDEVETEETPIPDMTVDKIAEGCYGGPAFSFGIGAHVSPDLVFHKITSTEQEFFAYIDERRSTEKSLESFHAGLDVYLQHRDGLTLRTGVEYAQINKRFTFNETWTVRNDSLDIDTTYTRVKQTTNRYRMVDIPLTVGYDINIPDWDLVLFVEAGVSMNVLFKKKGDILGPDAISNQEDPRFEPVTFTDGVEDQIDYYLNNVGLSFLGGIGARYEFRDGLFFFAQPTGKIYLNSFTKKDFPVSEKFSRIGLNLGVLYKL